MPDLYATEAAVAGQAVVDASIHARTDSAGALAWEAAGCSAALVLGLVSAPAFWR